MMMPEINSSTDIPIKIVGSSIFNKYPKISAEQTCNMIISDGWLVPYAGYAKSHTFPVTDTKIDIGRGIYNSVRYGMMFVVIGENIYKANSQGHYEWAWKTKSINTTPVYISENNSGQIVFVDGINSCIIIFNYLTNHWETLDIDFIPSYIEFQDGYFIVPIKSSPIWRLSGINDALTWNIFDSMKLALEADNAVAVIKLPSRGGQIFVFGEECTESWVNVGSSLFPYQKNTGYNIDYGCAGSETIAYSEEVVVWLAVNKHSNPIIMYSTGAEAIPITTDGISYKLSMLSHPELAFGFLFKQDGHLIYQITFPAPDDNYSLIYDFSTKMFFNVSDVNYNFHPARHVEVFNGKYYFISYKDSCLYSLSSDNTTYDGDIIPRSRITNTIRKKDATNFIPRKLTFICEQGQNVNPARIDLSISRDGGFSYGGDDSVEMNPYAQRKNTLVFRNLGQCNEFTARLRFWSSERVLASDGYISLRQ